MHRCSASLCPSLLLAAVTKRKRCAPPPLSPARSPASPRSRPSPAPRPSRSPRATPTAPGRRPSRSRTAPSRACRSRPSRRRVRPLLLLSPFLAPSPTARLTLLHSLAAFLGIPYAQPPVGDLRLRRPHSLEKGFEGGKVAATSYSPFVRPALSLLLFLVRVSLLTRSSRSQCPGIGGDDWGYELSEDCLTVNVLRPAGTTADDKLPVGFWIYGGGFSMGGNGDIRYNGSYAVQRSVEMEKPIVRRPRPPFLFPCSLLALDDAQPIELHELTHLLEPCRSTSRSTTASRRSASSRRASFAPRATSTSACTTSASRSTGCARTSARSAATRTR